MRSGLVGERHRLPDELGEVDVLKNAVNYVLRNHRTEGSRESRKKTTAGVHSYV